MRADRLYRRGRSRDARDIFQSLAKPSPGIPAPRLQVNNTPQRQMPNGVVPPTRDHPQANGNKMGNPNAPVKIVEYADFQCPYCMHYWQETEPQIIQNYVATGKVYYDIIPSADFSGPSSAAANAAYCAADQNKFWEYHDMLFANWTGENAGDFTSDKLRQYAAAIHLNLDRFDTCVNGGTHTDQVNQDASDAKAAGVQGTPAFVINGKLSKALSLIPLFNRPSMPR